MGANLSHVHYSQHHRHINNLKAHKRIWSQLHRTQEIVDWRPGDYRCLCLEPWGIGRNVFRQRCEGNGSGVGKSSQAWMFMFLLIPLYSFSYLQGKVLWRGVGFFWQRVLWAIEQGRLENFFITDSSIETPGRVSMKLLSFMAAFRGKGKGYEFYNPFWEIWILIRAEWAVRARGW